MPVNCAKESLVAEIHLKSTDFERRAIGPDPVNQQVCLVDINIFAIVGQAGRGGAIDRSTGSAGVLQLNEGVGVGINGCFESDASAEQEVALIRFAEIKIPFVELGTRTKLAGEFQVDLGGLSRDRTNQQERGGDQASGH